MTCAMLFPLSRVRSNFGCLRMSEGIIMPRLLVKGIQLLQGESHSTMRSADNNIKLAPTAIQDISHIQSKNE